MARKRIKLERRGSDNFTFTPSGEGEWQQAHTVATWAEYPTPTQPKREPGKRQRTKLPSKGRGR